MINKAKKVTIKVFTLLLIALPLTACTSEVPVEPKKVNMTDLIHRWQLTHVDNIRLAAMINSYLTIDPSHNASGNLGCNNFRAKAELNDNKLHLSQMGKTLKTCNELENSVEMDVTSVIRSSASVMVDNKTLIISNNQHSLTYYLLNKQTQ
jgi:heat shock protein HslJ